MRTRRIVALSDICVGGLVSNIRPTERHSSLDTQVEEMQLDADGRFSTYICPDGAGHA